jgi:peroxiredoxin
VNCDDEKPAADRAVERERLTWPSWWDGGETGRRIAEQWQIDAFPTLYLIDPDGVIRYKWQGKPEDHEIREAIEELLAKAKPRKG